MRVYLHTFGCKANQYDTETLRQALEAAGATVVNSVSQADAAVVNSCTVTHVGEGKMRGFVRRLERQRTDIKTVVTGCAAAVDDGTIAALPGVVDVVGGVDPHRVLGALDLAVAGPLDPILRSFSRGSRGWLKIQDGCDEHCTFCATTIARGQNRSRPPGEVIEEATVLADQHEELVLTGVHIGSYGCDRSDTSLAQLVELLVRRVPRVRFRLSSVEATELSEPLAEMMASDPGRVAPHLHAPLQSGSDRLLRRMGRHWYTAESYRERCESVANRVRAFGLGADVIVGFPSEDERDHSATRDLIASLPFTYLHVFPYSERPDASAQRLGPAVDPHVTRDRCAELREMVSQQAGAYRRSRENTVADVVVLGRQQERYRGLTEDFLDVYLSTDQPALPRLRARLRNDATGGIQAEPMAVQ